MSAIVIVGAGPIGCLASIYMKRRGLDVKIYERNPDLRRTVHHTKPSVNLTLCHRGLNTLRRANVFKSVEPILMPAYGRSIHGEDGTITYQPYGEPGQAIYSVSRRGLNAVLLDEAEQAGVPIEFENRCVDVDVSAGGISLATPTGARRVHADCFVGADGAFSMLRSKLLRRGRFNYSQEYSHLGYKELRVRPDEAGNPILSPGSLHLWPRHGVYTIAFPNPDHSSTCTVYLPFEGDLAFQSIATPEAVRELFQEYFTDLLPIVENLEQAFLSQQPDNLVTIRCSPWSLGGKFVLIGDAAHTILPFYGQGVNAGFEDCEVLDRLLQEYGPDFRRVFAAFEEQRRPSAEAIADLCVQHLTELNETASDPRFQERRRIERELHRRFPEQFRPLYSMIAFSSIPYADARERDLIQRQWVDRLLRQHEDLESRLDEPGFAAEISALSVAG